MHTWNDWDLLPFDFTGIVTVLLGTRWLLVPSRSTAVHLIIRYSKILKFNDIHSQFNQLNK